MTDKADANAIDAVLDARKSGRQLVPGLFAALFRKRYGKDWPEPKAGDTVPEWAVGNASWEALTLPVLIDAINDLDRRLRVAPWLA